MPSVPLLESCLFPLGIKLWYFPFVVSFWVDLAHAHTMSWLQKAVTLSLYDHLVFDLWYHFMPRLIIFCCYLYLENLPFLPWFHCFLFFIQISLSSLPSSFFVFSSIPRCRFWFILHSIFWSRLLDLLIDLEFDFLIIFPLYISFRYEDDFSYSVL